MKTRKNGLPITIEGYPIHINKNEKDFQVFLTHRNGDQTINGWFTYDDAVKEIKKQKKKERITPPYLYMVLHRSSSSSMSVH